MKMSKATYGFQSYIFEGADTICLPLIVILQPINNEYEYGAEN